MQSVGEKGLVFVALALCAILPAAPARAHDRRPRALTRSESPSCNASYARAAESAREARLTEASELYATCARAACSEPLRRQCAAGRAQIEADMPSLVPLVTDDTDEPRILVEVRIDGALRTSRLDGRALAVDPGKHVLSFSTDAGVFATRNLMVVQGERNRAIHVVLHESDRAPAPVAGGVARAADRVADAAKAPPPPPSEAAERQEEGEPAARPRARAPSPEAATTPAPVRAHAGAAAYLFGAVGLAGAGGYGLLTYWGRADNALLASCAPACTAASVRHVRELYWAADASLGVGLLSLAVSTWLFASPGAELPAPGGAGPVAIDVHATRAGGVAAVTGRF